MDPIKLCSKPAGLSNPKVLVLCLSWGWTITSEKWEAALWHISRTREQLFFRVWACLSLHSSVSLHLFPIFHLDLCLAMVQLSGQPQGEHTGSSINFLWQDRHWANEVVLFAIMASSWQNMSCRTSRRGIVWVGEGVGGYYWGYTSKLNGYKS